MYNVMFIILIPVACFAAGFAFVAMFRKYPLDRDYSKNNEQRRKSDSD